MPRSNTPSTLQRSFDRTLAVATAVVAAAIALASPAFATSVPPGSDGGSGDAVVRSCPCSGPAMGGVWRSHAQYVSCVTKEARAEARTTDLTATDARQMIRTGARSSCGNSSSSEGNVRVCAKNPVLPCPTVRTARVDDCTECAAALAGKLVHCARVATRDGETSVCGTTAAKLRPGSPQVLELRTGVDCASCKAKLGKPQAEGLDCVVASCGSALP